MIEAPEVVDQLVAAARDARAHAYAPYSGFAVGAAVLAESGEVYRGANIENASYSLTICAERVAIFTALAAGERRLRAVAVVTGAGEATSPCGACRQVLSEFGADALVIAETTTGARRTWTMPELLPDAFGPTSLRLRQGEA